MLPNGFELGDDFEVSSLASEGHPGLPHFLGESLKILQRPDSFLRSLSQVLANQRQIDAALVELDDWIDVDCRFAHDVDSTRGGSEGPSYLFLIALSTLQIPAPCAATNNHKKQYTTASSPLFSSGIGPCGKWAMK